jgi:alpha/beta superfamily hydrolase
MGVDEYPNDEPFRSAHDYLREYLMTAKTCVVIGFSFRDSPINAIFDTCMERNEELKLLVVSPSATQLIDQRFSTFRHRVQGIGVSFGEKEAVRKLAEALNKIEESRKGT